MSSATGHQRAWCFHAVLLPCDLPGESASYLPDDATAIVTELHRAQMLASVAVCGDRLPAERVHTMPHIEPIGCAECRGVLRLLAKIAGEVGGDE